MTAREPMAFADHAAEFLRTAPHTEPPFNKRNWGGTLHSLCSYHGKLKPSIAHFLVGNFTRVGDRVLDPMAGVGTIPLEARRLGRVGLAGDLSPVASVVSRAKLERVSEGVLYDELRRFELWMKQRAVVDRASADFGLNGPIATYFHPETLDEVLRARAYFMELKQEAQLSPEQAVLLTSLLHILHGNRPYALSRRSHPITPFAPRGEYEYRSVVELLSRRVDRVAPLLGELARSSPDGLSVESDFRDSARIFGQVDAVITSPPFTDSFRFWSMNWMRLWFVGWEPSDFKSEPQKFLEAEQVQSFAPYESFAHTMADVLRPGGSLILHLGETKNRNMAESIQPILEPEFDVQVIGREDVIKVEHHGVRDKGATHAHWYLFAVRRR